MFVLLVCMLLLPASLPADPVETRGTERAVQKDVERVTERERTPGPDPANESGRQKAQDHEPISTGRIEARPWMARH